MEFSHVLPSLSPDVSNLTQTKLLEENRFQCTDENKMINMQTGEESTFNFLRNQGDLLAKGLIALGLTRGDTISITDVVSNIAAGVFCAAVTMGVGFNHTQMHEPTLVTAKHVISVVAPKVLILGEGSTTGEVFNTIISQFDKGCIAPQSSIFPSVQHVFYDDFYRGRDISQYKFLKPVRMLIKAGQSISDEQLKKAKSDVRPEDVIHLTMSSGSTGKPKCITVTQRDKACQCLKQLEGKKPKLPWMVLSQNVGSEIAYMAVHHVLLGVSGTLVLLPEINAQQVTEDSRGLGKSVADQLIKHKIAGTTIPVFVLTLLMEHVEKHNIDLPALDTVFVTGQLTTPTFRERIVNTLKAIPLIGYGMTEVSPIGFTPFDSPEILEKALDGTLKPTDYMEIKLLTESGEVTRIGETGELCVKAPSMGMEYKNNPVLMKTLITDDGFFKTGDLAEMFPDGTFILKGRKADAERHKVFGLVVYPGPIEEVMSTHSSIADIVVVSGHSCDWRGAEIIYCIVLKKGVEQPSDKEIVDHCRQKLADRNWPTRIFYLPSLPYTDNLRKVSRSRVREMVLKEIEQNALAGITEWYKQLSESVGDETMA